jgi:ribonuclease Z
MNLNFQVKQINSPFEDTAFFVRNIYKKSAFLFDCGRLNKLTNSELLSISDIFISHTHIDHFYGFDRILRGSLCADKTIRVFGPKGIIKNVQGKIDSYTWNLIKSYNLNISVIELTEEFVFNQTDFNSYAGFVPQSKKIKLEDINFDNGFKFEFDFFDHGITSVGYKITEPQLIHINKDTLNDKGFIPDKWVGELTSSLQNKDYKKIIECKTTEGNKKFSVKDLEKTIVIYKKPQSISFITDISPSYKNIEKAVNFTKDSSILLIEGMFLKKDILHSIRKNHLTLELSKYIFEKSNSEFVKFFHFAPRYELDKEGFFNEIYKDIKDKILKNQ